MPLVIDTTRPCWYNQYGNLSEVSVICTMGKYSKLVFISVLQETCTFCPIVCFRCGNATDVRYKWNVQILFRSSQIDFADGKYKCKPFFGAMFSLKFCNIYHHFKQFDFFPVVNNSSKSAMKT